VKLPVRVINFYVTIIIIIEMEDKELNMKWEGRCFREAKRLNQQTKAKTTSSVQEKKQVSDAETQPEARSDLSSVTAFDYKFVEQSQEAKEFIG